MSLKGVAKTTLDILESGRYITDSGKTVEFLKKQRSAVRGTTLYNPDRAAELLAKPPEAQPERSPRIEVTSESTQQAARRLVQNDGCSDLVLLNYASARNAGGGFLTGAKAQEEDLCRCSGLYPCLLTQPRYYEINRNQRSFLYTDHIIYSPQVPFFRSSSRDLLEDIFLASVITAPGPNAGEVLRSKEAGWPEIETVLRRRAGMILAIAREQGHRSLLLGAWGCGVFRNQPSMVADVFGTWLTSPTFSNCFDRVTFAIYSRGEEDNLTAFQERFPAA
jgi:uncharacterized protein (TIGR02452 family)